LLSAIVVIAVFSLPSAIPDCQTTPPPPAHPQREAAPVNQHYRGMPASPCYHDVRPVGVGFEANVSAETGTRSARSFASGCNTRKVPL